MLTVAELIIQLKRIPDQDAEVVLFAGGVEFRVVEATISKMRANQLDASLQAAREVSP